RGACPPARGGEQPCLAVGLHDERVDAGDRCDARGALGRAVGRGTVGDEVRHIVAGPSSLLLVPPDQGLALAPRPAVRIRRRPVVEPPPVGGPSPSPLRRHPALLLAWRAAGRPAFSPGAGAALYLADAR